jgi:hypothetical protein
MDQIEIFLVLVNFILLVGLIAGIIWWQRKYGKLTEIRLTLLLLAYFSYSFISQMIPFFSINPGATIITIFGFLAILWGIGYPFLRWVYQQFNHPK